MKFAVKFLYATALAAAVTAGGSIMASAADAGSNPGLGIVRIDGGQVSGVGTDVDGIEVFKGLPFAGPTSGDNRFKPPQAVVPWAGVKVADQWGDMQLQNPQTNPTGQFWGDEFYWDPAFLPKPSEDAERLNVWTPAKTSKQNLPVYVWIHGGGNHHGYASEMEFVASKLAAKGIVVVSVQYRVGAPGFLSLKELSSESPHGVSGNYAMLDLVQALHWVHDNISGFGGNPAMVTIGGQSAGAQNATMLLRSPLAKGLFKRAVLESGFAGLLPMPMMDLKDREAANQKAIDAALGKPTTLADLRAIPANEMITKSLPDGKLLYDALHKAVNGGAQHTLDGYVYTKDSVDLLRPGALNGLDIMIGGNSDEFSSLDGGPDKRLSTGELAAAMQKFGYDNAWKAIYRPSDDLEAYRMSLRAKSDFYLQEYLVSAAYAKAHNKNLNVYSYDFNHAPPGRNSEFYGSFHSSELWYYFDSMRDVPGQRNWTSADHRLAATMSSYLANFVKTGNPNGKGLPVWKQPTVADNVAFMRFHDGDASLVTQTPYPERDKLNRELVLKKAGLTEADLRK